MTQPVTSGQDSSRCQRWTHQRGSWRHPSEGGFRPGDYLVAPVGEGAARTFVVEHHYCGTFPASRLCYGLHDRDGRLVGVAVRSVPMRAEVLTLPFPTLEPYRESLELGRFVLLDEVPANAESWFLGQSWRLAADAGVRGIVSFSDPMPRHRVLTLPDGRQLTETITPGHVGVIYQATNGIPAGRSTARTLIYLPRQGVVVPARLMSKIRRREGGADYAERYLVQLGAQPRSSRQDPRLWLHTAMLELGAERVSHPGNYPLSVAAGVTNPATAHRHRATDHLVPETLTQATPSCMHA